jgi:phage minor structural protein
VAFSYGGDNLIEILDRQLNSIAILENAYGDGYEKRFNEVGSQWFTLPLDDPKNEHCNAFNFVKYTLDGEYIGLYRIVPKYTRKDSSNNQIEYQCKHVIHTLVDSVLFRYHQTTNWTTRQNIEYILSKQKVQHWRLGICEFNRHFSYNFENENGLLSPLFSIPQPFNEEWEWQYDTRVYPFVLHLVKPDTTPSCIIREGHNRIGIEKEEPNEIFNRFYPLGYGEGVNQLGIEEVNGGVPYVEDPVSIAKYGLQEITWIDRRFVKAEELKANAESLLKQKANPVPMYRISAADVSPLTGEDIDKLKCGRIARVYDSDLGTFDLRIMSEIKSDARKNPGDIQSEVGNLTEDLATIQADLERKLQVNEAYSQGATNIDSRTFTDNCDPTHPAIIRFKIPDDLANYNSMLLNFETQPFRAYNRAIKGGGNLATSTESGGSSNQTSSSGGSVSTSTASGGSSNQTSSSGGSSVVSSDFADLANRTISTEQIISGVPYETHIHPIVLDSSLNHGHSVTIPSHTHSVFIPAHTHNFTVPSHTHTVDIPSHTHDLALPDHTHQIEFGIFELSDSPSSVTIEVDGNPLPFNSTSGENIDLIPYLDLDESGKIRRGGYVEIKITPNALSRINASVESRLFINSHIGGNY